MEPNKQTNTKNKWNLDIEKILPLIIEGWTVRKMAEHFGCPPSTLHDFMSRNTSSDGITADVVRVRVAQDMSATSFADRAIEILENAPSNMAEINRASNLARVLMWYASKRSPKTFGNNSEVDITNTTKIIKVGGDKAPE